jgi:methionyl-tRNA formyltransferase
LTTAFLGTSAFAAAVLERLAATDHRPALVVTRPDRPAGRGRRLTPPPVATLARDLGLDVIQPETVNSDDVRDAIAASGAADVVVCGFGALIKEPLLSSFELINVHPSLLPRWRGAAPVERAIMAGDHETGVTIIKLVEALDAGPIAAQEAFPIEAGDDAGAVYAKAGGLAAQLLDRVLAEPTFRPQPEAGATYAEKITAADRELDLSQPPDGLLDRIRALSPHIGARAELHGRPVTVWRAVIEDGTLVPIEVQPDGGRRMTYEEWLRGLR